MKQEFETANYFYAVQRYHDQCQEEIFLQKINPLIEKYDEIENQKGFTKVIFQRQNCFSLDHLYTGIQSKYYELEKSTVLDILDQILKHYQFIISKSQTHGNLKMESIIIQLRNDSDKLSTWSRHFSIQKVHFVNYNLKSNNEEQDQEDIINIVEKFIAPQKIESVLIQEIKNTKDLSINMKVLLIVHQINEQIKQMKTTLENNKSWNLSKKYFKSRWTWGNSCVKTLQDIIIEVDKKICFSDFSKIDEQLITSSLIFLEIFQQLYKQNTIKKVVNKRLSEIGDWLSNTYFCTFTSWDITQSQNILKEQINKFQQLMGGLNLAELEKVFPRVYQEIDDNLKKIFKLDVTLKKEEIYELCFRNIIFMIVDEKNLTVEIIINLLESSIKEAYQEEFKIQILNLIGEII